MVLKLFKDNLWLGPLFCLLVGIVSVPAASAAQPSEKNAESELAEAESELPEAAPEAQDAGPASQDKEADVFDPDPALRIAVQIAAGTSMMLLATGYFYASTIARIDDPEAGSFAPVIVTSSLIAATTPFLMTAFGSLLGGRGKLLSTSLGFLIGAAVAGGLTFLDAKTDATGLVLSFGAIVLLPPAGSFIGYQMTNKPRTKPSVGLLYDQRARAGGLALRLSF